MRYLLTDGEYRRYGRLKSPEARALFVDRLWRRFDPVPSTPPNEFRETFEARCAEADLRFNESTVPGWRTDRGKVFILLGAPDTARRDAGDASGRDRDVWTYSDALSPGSAPLEVIFRRAPDGEFRLDLESPEREPSAAAMGQRRRDLQLQLRVMYPGVSGLHFRTLVDEIIAGEADLRESRNRRRRSPNDGFQTEPRGTDANTAVESGPSLAFRDTTYFFQAVDGTVLTLVTIEFRPRTPEGPETPTDGHEGYYTAAVSVRELGAVMGLAAGPGARQVPLEIRPHPTADGRLFFVGRVFLEPGVAYEIRYLLEDHRLGTLSVRRDRLEAPDLGAGRFSASSVVPAERFGPASAAVGPFAVGSEEIVPRPDETFHRSEPLRIYLQVYGAAKDPVLQRPRVDVTFRFERFVRGKFKSFGRPPSVRGAAGASMGLALPIGDWSTGDYRVEVSLHDRVSGARAATEGSFHVVD